MTRTELAAFADAFRAVVRSHAVQSPDGGADAWPRILAQLELVLDSGDEAALIRLPQIWASVRAEYGWSADPRLMVQDGGTRSRRRVDDAVLPAAGPAH
jgi:hypothetical protein